MNQRVDPAFFPAWRETQGQPVDAEPKEVAIMSEVTGRVKALACLEELANLPLGIPLETWSRLSAPILAALQEPSPAPDVNGGMPKVEDRYEVTHDAVIRFAEWFRRNYPGPDTLIHKPDWHAPKIFRAVAHAIRESAAIATAEASRRSPDLTAVMGGVEKVLTDLLAVDVLDQDFNDPEWGCGETAVAVSAARDLLSRIRSKTEPSDADAK